MSVRIYVINSKTKDSGYFDTLPEEDIPEGYVEITEEDNKAIKSANQKEKQTIKDQIYKKAQQESFVKEKIRVKEKVSEKPESFGEGAKAVLQSASRGASLGLSPHLANVKSMVSPTGFTGAQNVELQQEEEKAMSQKYPIQSGIAEFAGSVLTPTGLIGKIPGVKGILPNVVKTLSKSVPKPVVDLTLKALNKIGEAPQLLQTIGKSAASGTVQSGISGVASSPATSDINEKIESGLLSAPFGAGLGALGGTVGVAGKEIGKNIIKSKMPKAINKEVQYDKMLEMMKSGDEALFGVKVPDTEAKGGFRVEKPKDIPQISEESRDFVMKRLKELTPKSSELAKVGNLIRKDNYKNIKDLTDKLINDLEMSPKESIVTSDNGIKIENVPSVEQNTPGKEDIVGIIKESIDRLGDLSAKSGEKEFLTAQQIKDEIRNIDISIFKLKDKYPTSYLKGKLSEYRKLLDKEYTNMLEEGKKFTSLNETQKKDLLKNKDDEVTARGIENVETLNKASDYKKEIADTMKNINTLYKEEQGTSLVKNKGGRSTVKDTGYFARTLEKAAKGETSVNVKNLEDVFNKLNYGLDEDKQLNPVEMARKVGFARELRPELYETSKNSKQVNELSRKIIATAAGGYIGLAANQLYDIITKDPVKAAAILENPQVLDFIKILRAPRYLIGKSKGEDTENRRNIRKELE